MIGRKTGASPDTVSPNALRSVKRIVTQAIAPLASGVLTDPMYGYPASVDVIPPGIGVLLANEKTGYRPAPEREKERRSRLLEDWSVEQTMQAGADAVKLLIYHHPDASAETRAHQKEIVRSVGTSCTANQVPFILEVKTYPLDERHTDPAMVARRKPDLVVRTVQTYSDPDFNVDLLKVEFPASLKHTEEYQDEPYGCGTTVYDRATVEEACRRLDEAASVPWVILSSGVDIDEFVENLRLANAAGGSGFLCGRAVWKHIIDHYPETENMADHMNTDGRGNFRDLLAVNESALPWFEHRRFADPQPSEQPA
jgi:tagatose 1,6-diphosphate aldolase